jgi:hypothetical protein
MRGLRAAWQHVMFFMISERVFKQFSQSVVNLVCQLGLMLSRVSMREADTIKNIPDNWTKGAQLLVFAGKLTALLSLGINDMQLKTSRGRSSDQWITRVV